MTRRTLFSLLAPQSNEPTDFMETYNKFAETLNDWVKEYRNGVFRLDLWNQADRLWQKLRGRK